MIVGAGTSGSVILKEMTTSSLVNGCVVCFVDDDRNKAGKFLNGVPVAGNRNDIPRLAEEYKIDEIYIAIPSASAKERKAIIEICRETGCQVKILPGIYQLINGEVSIAKLRNVEIEDVNIMSRVCTGDGIDIVGCEDVTMRNSFIRASDDCVCIKAASYPDPAANRNVKNILVEHCVLWNAEPGNAVEIGYEVRCDEISDITFRDLDIVHCEYEGNQSGGVLTIHNADRAHIHDIVYEDIRVEDAQEKFVDIKVLDSKYSLDRKRGSVENIYFRNVEILNGNFPVSIIRGFEMHTEMSRPRNIYFDNVVVLGKQVESPSDLHMVVELSDDILFNGTAHAKRNPF